MKGAIRRIASLIRNCVNDFVLSPLQFAAVSNASGKQNDTDIVCMITWG